MSLLQRLVEGLWKIDNVVKDVLDKHYNEHSPNNDCIYFPITIQNIIEVTMSSKRIKDDDS